MGFLNINLGDTHEPVVAPEGEYDLVVENVKGYEKEDTKNYVIRIGHVIEDRPADGGDYAPVYHYLSFPGPDDDDEKSRTKMRMIKRYLTMANIPFEADGFNEEDLYGARFRCKLTIEHNDETGNDNNRINVPRMQS